MTQSNEVLQKIAEVLVECGYAKLATTDGISILIEKIETRIKNGLTIANPFADTYEGIKQSHALEDWLRTATNDIPNATWRKSGYEYFDHNDCHHTWRLLRIKWCIEQLVEKGDG